jgi:hypothetical protein
MSEADRAAAKRGSLSDHVAKADPFDAARDHRAAVDQLAIGARNKDVDALTRLGKRLLVGDRAPALSPRQRRSWPCFMPSVRASVTAPQTRSKR